MSASYIRKKKNVLLEEPPQEHLYAVRVGRIPHKVKDEDVKKAFSSFGEIIKFARPQRLDKHFPAAFAFIKYRTEEEAKNAISQMDNFYIWETFITVEDGNEQESFFSKNTGGLINHAYHFPPREEEEFDNSLPADHYYMKRQQQLKTLDEVFPIKIEDLHPDISKEMLHEIFCTYGEIASIYHPVDLRHNCRPVGVAFVRFTTKNAAINAQREMNGTNLGVGRDIVISFPDKKGYFSQDETFYTKWGKMKNGQQQPVRLNNNSGGGGGSGGGYYSNAANTPYGEQA